MTPRQIFNRLPRPRIEVIAEKAGTTYNNFYVISRGGNVSAKLANKLAKASEGLMNRDEILFPEDYEESTAA